MSPLTIGIVVALFVLCVILTLGIMRGAKSADRTAEEMLRKRRERA